MACQRSWRRRYPCCPSCFKSPKRKTRTSVTKGASIDGVVGGMLMGFQAGMPCPPRLFKLRYI
ncbi:hypothetical protein DPMN_134133 [Dreissena polymorpha]|uniref:Uncharacterized protein n=1 Tax=Dreissena polymorpha TaxID=45954 RepID=A0A9D4FV16_DREPO|nr:hypothetical protein DPMN_134133 [Dreissena polymorpha]